MRVIPKTSKVKMTFYKNFTVMDIVIGIATLLLVAITLFFRGPAGSPQHLGTREEGAEDEDAERRIGGIPGMPCV